MYLVIHAFTFKDSDGYSVPEYDPIAIFDSEEKADAFIKKHQNLKGYYRVPSGIYAADLTGTCGDLAKIKMPLNAPVIPESDFWWKSKNPKPMEHFNYEDMLTH